MLICLYRECRVSLLFTAYHQLLLFTKFARVFFYDFPDGLPKIHEHDGAPPQAFGIFVDGRMLVFYTYESDLGDGWEDATVHEDPAETREQALRMGVNLFLYVLGQSAS